MIVGFAGSAGASRFLFNMAVSGEGVQESCGFV